MSDVLETAGSGSTEQPAGATRLDAALDRIRMAWRCHPTVGQIRDLLPTEPDRATRLLLELAEADLRDKVALAGLPVAEAAARLARLPAIVSADDLDGYGIDDLLDLACAIGLLDPAERQRLDRAWTAAAPDEEAFLDGVDLMLAREPVSPLRDITPEMILEALPGAAWTKELILNFASAPDLAQVQIETFLMQLIADDSRPAPLRNAALGGLRLLNAVARRSARAKVGDVFHTRLRRRLGTLPDLRISKALGLMPHLTEARIRRFFAHYLCDAQDAGATGRDEALTAFLDEFRALGGLAAVPPLLRGKIVLWMVRGYVGMTGRPGDSEAASPLRSRIQGLFRDAGGLIAEDFAAAAASDSVSAEVQGEAGAQRLDELSRILRDGR